MMGTFEVPTCENAGSFSTLAAGRELFVLASFVMMTNAAVALPRASEPAKTTNLRPTAVSGESWLQHLGRSFDETSMGKTGRLGPPRVEEAFPG